MLTRALTSISILSGALLSLSVGQAAIAAPARVPLAVSIQVTANPIEGSPRAACEASARVETGRQDWWAAFADVRPHSPEGWEAVGSRVGCGGGSFEKVSDSKVLSETPYLLASVSTAAGFLPSVLTPERVLSLNISLSLKELSGFGKGGEPIYQQSEVKRDFFLSDRREAFVPLLIANAAEMEAFGIREVFLKVAVASLGEESAAAYGVLSVTSRPPGGAILLDGGVVGRISAGAETALRNVPVGLRDVRVRDTSGRDSGEAVRVEKDRTVLVEVNLAGPPRDMSPHRLVTLGKNTPGYEEYRRESDGAVVVKIPAGDFLMGNAKTERSPLEHRVSVSGFLMDKTPVTWGLYKKFARATGIPLPPHDPYWGIHDDHPAVYVTWEEAKAYCEWAGGRLPTEAEREKAARGTDTRKYPWGDEEPDPQRGVYRHEWGYEATGAVGTHPMGASPYGLLDMGGNVWEYCSDWYDDGYYTVSPPRDPKGPPSGVARVVRGGSWDSRPSVLSCSCRNWAYKGYREGDFGFRCAMNAPK